jgi:hypothetical protein
MNNKPVGGRSLETYSHPINMIIVVIINVVAFGLNHLRYCVSMIRANCQACVRWFLRKEGYIASYHPARS